MITSSFNTIVGKAVSWFVIGCAPVIVRRSRGDELKLMKRRLLKEESAARL